MSKVRMTFLMLAMTAVASCGGLGLDVCDGTEWYRDDPRRNSGERCPHVPSIVPASRLDAARAQRIASASPPRETVTAQNAREAGLASRSDSLLMSSRAIENYSRDLPFILLPPSRCSGTTCTFRDPEGFADGARFSVSTFAAIPGGRAILTKNGITMVEARDDSTYNYLSYSSILRHSAFGIGRRQSSFVDRRGYAYGDLSSEKPTAAAAWRGLMVGMPQRSNDILQGDASLRYTFGASSGRLSASFTNIRNLSRNTTHSRPTAAFADINVGNDGTFSAGSARNRISGAFYGANQAEAAGVFEQGGIVGAFGARRLASP